VTRKEVAKLANVSETTVSVVLSGNENIIIARETKERVLQAARELGYHASYAAKTMASRNPMTIGVLSPWNSEVWHFAEALDGIKQEAAQRGYGVLLCNTFDAQNEPDDCVRYFHEGRIGGVVYLPPSTVELPGFDLLCENNVPTVLCNGFHPDNPVDYVVIDYAHDISNAAKHLYDSGFTNLLYILPGKMEELCSGDRDRVLGFDAAAAELGCKSSKEIFHAAAELAGRIETAKQLLTKYDKPLGIVSCYWIFANYLQLAAVELGLVIDKDVRVISGDCPVFAKELYPKINGIALPFKEIGRLSAEMLINRLEDRSNTIKQIKIKSNCSFKQG
jgi:DNA-binding LacI/PurR family transcriptional regulator